MPKNLRKDHAPQKFEKRPCSIEKFGKRHAPSKNEHDHAPSKNEYDSVPPKCDKWPQNLLEHGHFSNFGGTESYSFFHQIENSLEMFRNDCNWIFYFHPLSCSAKMWKMNEKSSRLWWIGVHNYSE